MRGVTRVAEWNEAAGEVLEREVTPADFGLDSSDPAGLSGGNAEQNAQVFRRVLDGEEGAVRNAAVMEAAVALNAVDVATDFAEGAEVMRVSTPVEISRR